MLKEKINYFDKNCKVNGKEYLPYKQNDKTKSISNYRIHSSSIEPYRNVGQKIISYAIKCLDRVFIIGAKFVFKDKFSPNFFVVGLTPQFKHWTRTNKIDFEAGKNISVMAYNLYNDMIQLEKHDFNKWGIYENNLMKIFQRSKEQRAKKSEFMIRLKNEFTTQESEKVTSNKYDNEILTNEIEKPPDKISDQELNEMLEKI